MGCRPYSSPSEGSLGISSAFAPSDFTIASARPSPDCAVRSYELLEARLQSVLFFDEIRVLALRLRGLVL